MADLQSLIEQLWEQRADLAVDDVDANRAVLEAITLLDRGEARVAEIVPDGTVVVHEWLKLAILLYFQQSADGHHRARAVRVRRQDPAQARLRGGRRAGRARRIGPVRVVPRPGRR